MSNSSDFLAEMKAKHPAPPAPAGNPWDHLPATHQTTTQWYDPARNAWLDKTPAAPPPPPVAAVPINPPAPPPPPAATVPPAPPPPPAAPPAPAPVQAPAPPEVVVIHATAQDAYETIATALESLADGIRALGGEPPKRGPGRPRKAKP